MQRSTSSLALTAALAAVLLGVAGGLGASAQISLGGEGADSSKITGMADTAIVYETTNSDWLWLMSQGGFTNVSVRDESRSSGSKDKYFDAKYSGVPVLVTTFNCSPNAACGSVLYRVYFGKQPQLTASMIGGFNERALGKLYVSNNGDVVLTWGVWYAPGVTKKFMTELSRMFKVQFDTALALKP